MISVRGEVAFGLVHASHRLCPSSGLGPVATEGLCPATPTTQVGSQSLACLRRPRQAPAAHRESVRRKLHHGACQLRRHVPTTDSDERAGEGPHAHIKPSQTVPRRSGWNSGDDTHAVTRSPPSHSVCFPPRSGRFVAWSSGPPLSEQKAITELENIPAFSSAARTAPTPSSSLVIMAPALMKRLCSELNASHVCPEPVLANIRSSSIKWLSTKTFPHRRPCMCQALSCCRGPRWPAVPADWPGHS